MDVVLSQRMASKVLSLFAEMKSNTRVMPCVNGENVSSCEFSDVFTDNAVSANRKH